MRDMIRNTVKSRVKAGKRKENSNFPIENEQQNRKSINNIIKAFHFLVNVDAGDFACLGSRTLSPPSLL